MMPDACSTVGRRSSIIDQNGKIMHADCQHVCNIDPRYRPPRNLPLPKAEYIQEDTLYCTFLALGLIQTEAICPQPSLEFHKYSKMPFEIQTDA